MLVGAKKADVEIVAGILEIVGIAAKERRVELRSEDQADVSVFLVRIKMVLPALIEGDHVAAQARLVGRFLLDLGHRLPPGLLGRGVVQAGSHTGGDARGHVLDADQHIELEIGGLGLLVVGLGEEAVAVVVLVLRAELRQCVGADVVVGHDQPVNRDERPRPAIVEPHRRRPQMIGPSRRRLETIPGLERAQREVVKHPHPFVGAGRRGGAHEKETGKKESMSMTQEHQSMLLIAIRPARMPACRPSILEFPPWPEGGRADHATEGLPIRPSSKRCGQTVKGAGADGFRLADHELSALRRLGPVEVAASIAATVPPDPERIAPNRRRGPGLTALRQSGRHEHRGSARRRRFGATRGPASRRREAVLRSRGRRGTRRRSAAGAWDKSLGSGDEIECSLGRATAGSVRKPGPEIVIWTSIIVAATAVDRNAPCSPRRTIAKRE